MNRARCRGCGKPRPVRHSPAGLCPVCLLKAGQADSGLSCELDRLELTVSLAPARSSAFANLAESLGRPAADPVDRHRPRRRCLAPDQTPLARDAGRERSNGSLPALRRDRPRRHGRRPQGPRRRPRPRPRRQGPARVSTATSPSSSAASSRRRRSPASSSTRASCPSTSSGTFADRPPVLHHEAGQGPDAGRAARPRTATRRRTCRGSWGSSSRSARRSPTPTPGA